MDTPDVNVGYGQGTGYETPPSVVTAPPAVDTGYAPVVRPPAPYGEGGSAPPAPVKENRIQKVIDKYFPDDPGHEDASLYTRIRNALMEMAGPL